MKPKVYIIILNYNNWQDTIECLESVLRNDYPNYQVIVVDNNSPNNSMEYLRAWAEGKLDVWVSPNNPLRSLSFPPVPKPIPYVYYTRKESEEGGNPEIEESLKNNIPEGITTKYPIIFIQSGDNLGFAGGNNIGIRYALAKGDFEYIWILNNDTVIQKDALTRMVEVIKTDQKIGAVGSLLLFYHNPNIIQACGGTTKFSFFKPLRELYRNRNKNEVVLRDSFKIHNGFLQGASVLLRKDAIEEVGLFDEALFMMFDESELCMRLIKKGWSIYCSCKSIVYHKEGRSREQEKAVIKRFFWKASRRLHLNDSKFILYLYNRNLLYSIKKHYGSPYVFLYLLLNIPTYLRLVLGILLLDDNKLFRLNLLKMAIIDGITGNLKSIKELPNVREK